MTTTQEKINTAQIDDTFMSDEQNKEFRSLIGDGVSAWDAYDAALQTR